MSKLLNREDVIHFVVRKCLMEQGWKLVAGEYPDGSDDQLHSLRVMDPVFAKDDSPDNRRHSINKLIPDLVTYKDSEFLIIEMKPKYDKGDELKLEKLLGERILDFKSCLKEFIHRYMLGEKIDIDLSTFTPCLGFSNGDYPRKDGFAYIVVNDLDSITLKRN